LPISPCGVVAQEKSSSYLYDVYQAKSDFDVFKSIEVIKKAKKDTITARINALSPSSKTEIIKAADLAAGTPWTLLNLSDFNEFKLNGNRVNYENKYFARRNKLNTLLIGELIAKDGRYLKDIVDGLGLICEESTWALPAHMSLQKAGNGIPDVDEPIIDLFVSQTAMILSYSKYLLGDSLNAYSPLLIKRIDKELKRRVFEPYINADFWWMGFNTKRRMNNWNIFINSNVLSATLLAEKDVKTQALIIEKSIKSVDHFLASYPADGGCDEGPSYWGMAGGALIEYIDMLSVFSGRQLDFSNINLIHQMGTYIYKVHIAGNYYVNFADAGVANVQDAGKVLKFGKLFNDDKLLQFSAYLRQINRGAETFDLGNINGFVNGLELLEDFKGIKPLAPQLKYSWLADVQILTARQETGNEKGLFFAAKGGNNGESHNHNDVGNFVVYKDGVPMIIDAGVGTYTKQTFSSNRYQLWYTQSAWHNCPTINGVMQQSGKQFKAKSIASTLQESLTKLTMDLSSAYPEAALVNYWNRSFTLNNEKGILVLKEDYLLKRFKEASSSNFLINVIVISAAKGVLKITNASGTSMTIVYDANKFDYEVEVKKIDDARLATSWQHDLSRLILKSKSSKLLGTHQIEFRKE
ncbi:MAG: hypothetical protein EOO89_18660, partial [Pedobacter sp.]